MFIYKPKDTVNYFGRTAVIIELRPDEIYYTWGTDKVKGIQKQEVIESYLIEVNGVGGFTVMAHHIHEQNTGYAQLSAMFDICREQMADAIDLVRSALNSTKGTAQDRNKCAAEMCDKIHDVFATTEDYDPALAIQEMEDQIFQNGE